MKKSIILLLAMVCAITACQESQVEEVRDIDNCSSHHFCIETSFPNLENISQMTTLLRGSCSNKIEKSPFADTKSDLI